MRKSISSFVIFATVASLLTGCATAYQGPGPNFNLKGAEAEHEIENFTMDTSYFYHSPHVYQMGAEGSPYFASSLTPMIREVSPRAAKGLMHARWWEAADYAFVLAALGLLIAYNENPQRAEGAYWGLLGLGIGSGITANITVSHALSDYNHDLRQKFSPQANVNYSF